MRRALAAFLLLAPAPCGAVRWWWNAVPDRWASRPPVIDGKEGEWYSDAVFEDRSLSFRALNDEENLYLLITAAGRDGRALLSGAFRQDLTFWFYDAGRKQKTWGLRCPFSRLEPPDLVAVEEVQRLGAAPSMPAFQPEMALASGPDISTAPLSAGIEFRAGLSGKNPVYELKIPLSEAGGEPGGKIAVDFVVAKVDPEIELQVRIADRRNQPRESRREQGIRLTETPRSRFAAPPPLKRQLFVRPARKPKP